MASHAMFTALGRRTANDVWPKQPAVGSDRGEAQHSALTKSVLLLGNYRPTLWVARALAKAGWRVIVSRGGGEGCAEYSRDVSEAWDHPDPAAAPAHFMAALSQFLAERPEVGVVYPVGEEFLACVAQHRSQLPDSITLAAVSPEIFAICQNKVAMLEQAKACGLGLEPFRVVESYDGLISASREIGYPIVLRPLTPGLWFGDNKALDCADEAALRQALPIWPRGQQRLLLQKKAKGVRHNVFFAAKSGRLIRTLETRILRTDRFDGTGFAVEGESVKPSPVLTADTEALVASLDYTGIGLAQYILDEETGQRCFLELNPRIAGSHSICEHFGMGLSELAIDLAPDAPIQAPDEEFTYAAGVRYAWTYGDIRGLHRALANREIGIGGASRWLLDMGLALLKSANHMTWQWRDPLPSIMLFMKLLPGVGYLTASSAKS